MAQLRDAKTSEVIAQGTPLEVALVARTLPGSAIVPQPGQDLPADVEMIYDDVGLGFDPDAVLALHEQQLAATPSDQATKHEEQAVARLVKQAEELEQAATGQLADTAMQALEQARAKAS